ncbi:MAG: FecR family protein [Treponema sp.]|nr:FecR family protein [Treponema sp.]
MTGTVELKVPGSADWIPGKKGSRVLPNTVISTGFRSTALLAVGDSTIAVQPLTRLSLEELIKQAGTERASLNLHTGRIRAQVAPPAAGSIEFSVRSPMATASVRGTAFNFDTLNLEVRKGAVSFAPAIQGTASSRPVLVRAGESSRIDADSGRVLSPQAAAETSRTPPALPGREAAAALKTAVPQGSLAVQVTLESE